MSEKKQNHIKTVALVVIITLLGKILGLLRDMLLGHNFGTGIEGSAFLAASQIPRNFFDAVFASAISSSFIPIFNEQLETKGKDEAFRLTRSFLTLMGVLTVALSGLGVLFAPQLTALFAKGFDGETAALCTSLLRILFPTIFFTGIAFSMVGVLQSMGEFNIPAAMSVVSNGIIIVYYLVFCRQFGIYGLTIAFLLGWLMQAVIQFPSMHRFGFRYRPSLWHPALKGVFALMLPVMVSTWIQPINQAVSTYYASFLFDGAGVSALTYANTLYLIITSVLVLSVTNVIFPEMSRLSIQGDGEGMTSLIRTALRSILFLLIPMTAGLMLLSTPLIRLLYQHGVWDDFSTQITSRALVFLALGMVGYGIQNILIRAFYAEKNGRAPLLTGVVSIVVNLVLCMVLCPIWDVAGLALANSISLTVSALLLMLLIGRRYSGIFNRAFLGDIFKMLLSAAAMGGAVAAVGYGLSSVLSAGTLSDILVLGASVAVGCLVYFVLAALFRLPELSLVTSKLRKFQTKGGN